MLQLRLVIALVMIAVVGYVVYRMLQYPLAQSFTGLVLGGAMIALGVLRVRQIRSVSKP
jgi:putative effector of murein hydrolase LrgA (UPF0299 family)